MVHVAAAIVTHGGADVFGNRGAVVGEQFLDRFILQVGMRFERLVQVRHVGAVVLLVMDLHRGLVDVRLECVRGIR